VQGDPAARGRSAFLSARHPFFLGLAIGHFFCAGLFWPVMSLFMVPAASSSYHLYFGG
jgi:hypothetical protein